MLTAPSARAPCSPSRTAIRLAALVALVLMPVAATNAQSTVRLVPQPIATALETLPFRISNAPPMAVSASGCVVLFDLDASQVTCIDPGKGSTVRFGRSGDGPGEFRAVLDLLAARDGRVVVLTNARLSIIDPSWKTARDIRPAARFTQLGRVTGDSIYGLGAGYDTVYAVAVRDGSMNARFGQRRADSALFIGTLPYERGFWIVPRGEHDWYVSSGFRYVILLEDGKGIEHARIQPAAKAEYPTVAELAETRQVMQKGNPGMNLDGFMKEMAAAPKAFIAAPPAQDASGRLWVVTGRIRSDSTEVDVFAPAGSFLRTIRVGGSVKRIAIVRNELYAIVKELAGSATGDIGVRRFRIEH